MTNMERNSVFVQGVNEGIKTGSLNSIDEINSLASIDISQSLARIADSLEKLVSEQNWRDQNANG